MVNKIIALDLDSTLFPLNELVVLPALRAAGFDVKMWDITTFDWEECLGPEVKKIAMSVYMRPDLYDGLELSDEAIRLLDSLRRRYSRVIMVTSPFQQHAGSKWAFCQRAGFAHKDIFMCGDKALVNFDVLLDDRAETCAKIGPRRAVIFDRPWNRDLSPYFTRAYSLEDAERKIGRAVARQLVEVME